MPPTPHLPVLKLRSLACSSLSLAMVINVSTFSLRSSIPSFACARHRRQQKVRRKTRVDIRMGGGGSQDGPMVHKATGASS